MSCPGRDHPKGKQRELLTAGTQCPPQGLPVSALDRAWPTAQPPGQPPASNCLMVTCTWTPHHHLRLHIQETKLTSLRPAGVPPIQSTDSPLPPSGLSGMDDSSSKPSAEPPPLWSLLSRFSAWVCGLSLTLCVKVLFAIQKFYIFMLSQLLTFPSPLVLLQFIFNLPRINFCIWCEVEF